MNDSYGWQGPGYQPGPSVRTTAFDTSTAPARPRGNLLGLAVVVGLFGFFLADAVPGGLNAVATFFIAAGAVLLLFLLAVAVALIVRRTRQPAANPPAPVAAPATRLPHRLVPAGPAAEAEDVIRPALPGSRRYFLRVVDELLAAVDALPEHQGREIEADVLTFATSADPLDLVDLIERRRGVPEIQRFVILAEQLTGPLAGARPARPPHHRRRTPSAARPPGRRDHVVRRRRHHGRGPGAGDRGLSGRVPRVGPDRAQRCGDIAGRALVW